MLSSAVCLMITSCNNAPKENESTQTSGNEQEAAASIPVGQKDIKDDVSAPNVVKVAIGSKDHTTLVKAVQAADLVNALSNNGPFTVFAPTNAAFDALPAGTLDNLMKPESKDALTNILYHHVQVSIYKTENFNHEVFLYHTVAFFFHTSFFVFFDEISFFVVSTFNILELCVVVHSIIFLIIRIEDVLFSYAF